MIISTCKDPSAPKLKRKRPKKVKTGMFPGSKPGQRLVLNKKQEISKNDSEDKVAEELTYRLVLFCSFSFDSFCSSRSTRK